MRYIGEAEDSQNTKDEDIKSNHDIPDIFRDVKDIPSVFTINSFNFTTKTDVKNCECIVDKNEIRKNSKFASYIYYVISRMNSGIFEFSESNLNLNRLFRIAQIVDIQKRQGARW